MDKELLIKVYNKVLSKEVAQIMIENLNTKH